MTRTHGTLVVLAALSLLMAGCGDDSPVAPVVEPQWTPAPLPDTAPPATPTGVYAEVQSRRVKLRWNPNVTDLDCAGFLLSRTAAGATVHLLADPSHATVYVDTHPFAGIAVYEVYAIDGAGNLSAAATYVVDFVLDGAELESDQ